MLKWYHPNKARLSLGKQKGTNMLIKFQTTAEQDKMIDELRDFFSEATASKAIQKAFMAFLELHQETNYWNAKYIGQRSLVADAQAIFKMENDVAYNKTRFLELAEATNDKEN